MARVVAHTRARFRLARHLAHVIASSDITKAELARLAHVSRNTLDLILKARCGPTLDSLARIADALDVDIIDLFGAPTMRPRRSKQSRRARA